MTRIPAPKPDNFDALADAWNDPEQFARELNAYYAQLRDEGASDRPERGDIR